MAMMAEGRELQGNGRQQFNRHSMHRHGIVPNSNSHQWNQWKSPAHTMPSFDCLFLVYTSYCVNASTCNYLFTTVNFSTSAPVDRHFLIDSIFRVSTVRIFFYSQWLVMPMRNRNFYAKSSQRKYLRKPMLNIRNLYSPFNVEPISNGSSYACSVCRRIWVNEFTNTRTMFTLVFVHLWIWWFLYLHSLPFFSENIQPCDITK